MRTKKKTGN